MNLVEKSATKTVKVTVNLPQDAVDVLQAMKQRSGGTVTQALKDAIALKDYLESEVFEHKAKILIERDGQIRELVLLP